MAEFDFESMQIQDEKNDTDLMKDIIENTGDDEPFYIFDAENVVDNHKRWLAKMPRVVPHYAVKCNPDPSLVRVLAALNANFDCASKAEIQLVIETGVSCDRIVYTQLCKALSHIEYAKKVGVDRTSVDSKDEVLRIKKVYPEAKLMIRLALDGSPECCGVTYSEKFGCEPTTEAIEVMDYIKELGMTFLGFCFHLGSPCSDTASYGNSIKICNHLLSVAKTMGHSEANVIDIGGGIDGKDDEFFDRVAASINAALVDVDPSVYVIGEPGRYYAETAFTLCVIINKKRTVKKGEDIKQVYYINDGTYGAFIEELLNLSQRIPVPLYHHSDEKYPSTIWGRTADPYDIVIKNEVMEDFRAGDWLVWKNIGAYSRSLATTFNGFAPARVHPFIRKSALKNLLAEIKNSQFSQQKKLNSLDTYDPRGK